MNFKHVSRAQFSKLRNGINGVGVFQYDTICFQNSVSMGLLVWKLLGGTKFYKHTHTHTHTHTHIEAHFKNLVFCKNAETRLKRT